MKVKKLLFAATLATSVMTCFSYIVSLICKENFREPELLEILIMRLFPFQPKFLNSIEAWVIHYSIGVFFLLVYVMVNKKISEPFPRRSGLLFGCLCSVPAVLVWHLTLKTHPHPPEVDILPFYLQLIVAHIIFGVVAVLAYQPSQKPGVPH